jgi:hypothetical protein
MSPEQTTLDQLYALASAESEKGYLHFLSHVVVDAQPKKLVFRLIAEQWQWERAMRISGAIDSLAGIDRAYNGPRWFWNGYHKGSDKTHETARQLCFLLKYSRRRLNIVICAGTEDQAALITKAMTGIVLDNPWIADGVQVTKLTATGVSGSELTVLTKNAYTQSGAFPDMIVVEELTHWQYEESKLFWESFILGSINKRPYCVLEVVTNAGHKGSWQWKERNRIQKSPYWSFFEAPEGAPLPSWMDNKKIADASSGMMPGERDRLYRNRWVDPGEEHGYLTEAEALLCRDYTLTELGKGDRSKSYYLVIDYGGVNDRCSLSIQHVEGVSTYDPATNQYNLNPSKAVIDRLDCWQGTHENRVDILTDPTNPDRRSVQAWIDISLKNFNVTALIVDPAQLEGLAIYYERLGIRVIRFEYKAGKANYRMAQMLKTSVQNRVVSWSPYAGRLPDAYMENGRLIPIEDVTLEQELGMLIVKPTQWGYRFDHESGRHDDRAVCLAMGLLHAFPEGAPLSVGPQPIPDPNRLKPVLGNNRHSIDTQTTVLPDSLAGSPTRWNLFGAGGNGHNGFTGPSKWDQGEID